MCDYGTSVHVHVHEHNTCIIQAREKCQGVGKSGFFWVFLGGGFGGLILYQDFFGPSLGGVGEAKSLN